MISEIAWENIAWLKTTMFDRLHQFGGQLIAVDSFRPFLKRSWFNRLRPETARYRLIEGLRRWAKVANSQLLFVPEYPVVLDEDPATRTHLRNVPRFGGEMTRIHWLLIRSHYNLYCLATHRRTIEELAIGAYAYCSRADVHTEDYDKAARSDLKRLLKLSNTFLLAEWVHDMIELAIANRDQAFFRDISNSVKVDKMAAATTQGVQWLLVVLLWFLGGKDILPRREFLRLLIEEGILPKAMGVNEDEFRSQLSILGLTST